MTGESYERLAPMTHERQHEVLKNIAIVNLKKASGKETVPDKALGAVACQHREFIKREIELCDPDLIIACGKGVFSVLRDIVYDDHTGMQKVNGISNYGGCAFDIGKTLGKEKSVYVIEYRHPSTGCGKEQSYNDMLNIKSFI